MIGLISGFAIAGSASGQVPNTLLKASEVPKSAGVYKRGNAPADFFAAEIPFSALEKAVLKFEVRTEEKPELADFKGTLDGKPFEGKITIVRKHDVETKLSVADLVRQLDPLNRRVDELKALNLDKELTALETLLQVLAVYKETTHKDRSNFDVIVNGEKRYFKHALFDRIDEKERRNRSNPLHVVAKRKGDQIDSITVIMEQIDHSNKGFTALYCKRYVLGYYLPTWVPGDPPSLFSQKVVRNVPNERSYESSEVVILEIPRDADFAVKNAGPRENQDLLGKKVKKYVLDPEDGEIKLTDVKPKANVSSFEYDLSAKNLFPDLFAMLAGKRQPYTIFLSNGRVSSESRDAKASAKIEFRSLFREGSPSPNRWFSGLVIQGNQHLDNIQTLGTIGQKFHFDLLKNRGLNDGEFRPISETLAIPTLEVAAEAGYLPEYDAEVFGASLPSRFISRLRVSLDTQPLDIGLSFIKAQAKYELYINPWPRYAGGPDAGSLAEFFQLSLLFKTSSLEALRVSYEGGAKASAAFKRTSPTFSFGLDKKF